MPHENKNMSMHNVINALTYVYKVIKLLLQNTGISIHHSGCSFSKTQNQLVLTRL